MNSLKNELIERFGMDGMGALAETNWLGRDNSRVTVEEFEKWSGAKLNKIDRYSNEYGTEDIKVTLIDEAGDDFQMTLEIAIDKDGVEVIRESLY